MMLAAEHEARDMLSTRLAQSLIEFGQWEPLRRERATGDEAERELHSRVDALSTALDVAREAAHARRRQHREAETPATRRTSVELRHATAMSRTWAVPLS